MRITLTIIFAFLTFASNCEKNTTVETNPVEINPKQFSLEMSRTVCYGRCPAYTLNVENDGKVIFVGKDFTETKGKAEGQISKEKVKELITEINNAKFFSFKDDYGYDSKNCTEISTDMPSVTLKIRVDETEKTITHYHGCFVKDSSGNGGALKPLTNLEDKIDEIVGTKVWIGERN